MPQNPPPPLTALDDLPAQLAGAGWAVLDAASLGRLAGVPAAQLDAWKPLWDELPPDPHLRDGGRYRRRRHGCFVVDGEQVRPAPHRAHWQPVEYNALHGGFERWFEPLPPALVADPSWTRLLRALAGVASGLRGAQPWYVEAHPFRIDTEGGIGRPTPEGAHRDGVDLVAVVLVARHNVKGGEARVFDARGPQGLRFVLHEPFSVLLLDDERVIHETTPIQPLDPEAPAWRDTLVLTFRRGGFQGPEAEAGAAAGSAAR
ncbi:MAG: 2OG-Fe dioxygenase family protein [Rubrivivax sp.]|nr:2OG-Fe dioxygenase family protein [Rubrivivax sp.]